MIAARPPVTAPLLDSTEIAHDGEKAEQVLARRFCPRGKTEIVPRGDAPLRKS